MSLKFYIENGEVHATDVFVEGDAQLSGGLVAFSAQGGTEDIELRSIVAGLTGDITDISGDVIDNASDIAAIGGATVTLSDDSILSGTVLSGYSVVNGLIVAL